MNDLGIFFTVWLAVLSADAAALDPPQAKAPATVATIRTFNPIVEGHAVGGVAIDQLGNLYVADFGETVAKITPEGEAHAFADGLYGASGNAIDNQGNLLQANYYGNSITKVDRLGHATDLVTDGLSGPVGIAVDSHTGDIFVANCRGNDIVKISANGAHVLFAKSDLFACPNGLAFGRAGNLFVVNFRNNKMMKVDAQGTVSLFAEISKKGLGHLCFKNDRFYVTAFASHELYEVTLDGTAKRILGNGQRGLVDGDSVEARMSFPNGIACHPWVPRLYINEYANETEESLPRRSLVREITLTATQ